MGKRKRGKKTQNLPVGMQSPRLIENQRIVELLPKLANLKDLYELQIVTDIEKVKDQWDAKGMNYPDWYAPYFAKSFEKNVCHYYNHSAGYGCPKDICRANHICMICGNESHGAFFYKGENPVCGVSASHIKEIELLKKNHISEDEFKSFIDRSLPVDSASPVVSFSPLELLSPLVLHSPPSPPSPPLPIVFHFLPPLECPDREELPSPPQVFDSLSPELSPHVPGINYIERHRGSVMYNSSSALDLCVSQELAMITIANMNDQFACDGELTEFNLALIQKLYAQLGEHIENIMRIFKEKK